MSVPIDQKIVFSLIIPTYNEAKNIEALCMSLTEVLQRYGLPYEIIVVDDDSPDRTWEIVESLARVNTHIRLLRRTQEKGLGTAVIAGWGIARGDILGVIDGDFQHPPEILPSMLKHIIQESDLDIVVASRNVKGGGVSQWSMDRRFISWMGTCVAAFLLPDILSQIRDPMSGYFILRRKVVDGVVLKPIGYKILLEVLASRNFGRAMEFPYYFQERKEGGSKAGVGQYLTSFRHFFVLSVRTKQIYKSVLGVVLKLALLAGVVMALKLCLGFNPLYAALCVLCAVAIMILLKSRKARVPVSSTEVGVGYYHQVYENTRVQRYWHRKKFELISERLGNSPVIDVGSGPGVFFHLYKKPEGVKINLDNACEQLIYGRSLNPDAHYINASVVDLPLRSQCAGTTCLIETIEHLHRKEGELILKELYRVLAPGGTAVISTPNYRSLWPLFEVLISKFGPIDYTVQHVSHYDLSKLVELIESAGFTVTTRQTFFIVSPFAAFLSLRLADMLYRLEERLAPRFGSIILITARKNG